MQHTKETLKKHATPQLLATPYWLLSYIAAMKRWVFIIFLWMISLYAFGQGKHIFSWVNMIFYWMVNPSRSLAARCTRKNTQDIGDSAFKMAKAMVVNTIAAYIFWNYHETTPGVFDFKTENRILLNSSGSVTGKNVGAGPSGPYVCAEWDFGGLPSYLLKIPGIKYVAWIRGI